VVLLCGRAAVLAHGRQVAVLAEGDTVGEVSLLDGSASAISAVAQTYVEALVLGPREFNALLWQAPSLGRRLATQLAGRLRVA
jgi:CRP-like cAMP-binding protein